MSGATTPVTLTGWLREPRADAGLHFLEDDDSWRYVTYDGLAGRVAAMAEVFREQGLDGQRLALVGATSEDFVVQLFATLATGGTCVPIPNLLAGQDRGAHDRQVSTVLETARPARVVVAGGGEGATGWPTATVPGHGELAPLGDVRIEESDAPAVIQFTSGTTGVSKGVRMSRRTLEAGFSKGIAWFGLAPSDRSVSWIPLWMAAHVLATVSAQSDAMLMTPLQFLERPDRWLRCLGQLGCTSTSCPSFAYHHAVRTVPPETLDGCRFDDWHTALIFAEPVRAADLDEFVAAFGPLGFQRRAFCPSYGMTEVASIITGTRPEEEPLALASTRAEHPGAGVEVLAEAVHTSGAGGQMIGVGRPTPGTKVAVRLPDGTEAPEGVLGEVWVGGDCLAEGYEGGEEFGDWLATGDVGCFHDGALFLFGRLTDSFNIRGQLIAAPVAEQTVRDALPDAGSLVVLPSRATGAGITVVMESSEPWPLERTDQARQTVSDLYKKTEVDVLVVPSGAIPLTENGKPRRREAWERYVLGRA